MTTGVVRRPGTLRRLAGSVTLAALAALAACSGRGSAGDPGPPPDLAGARVMIVPARAGEPAAVDRELVFWLTDRAPATGWILPDRIEETVASNPGWQFQLDAPRRYADLGSGRLQLRDPLYGDLRRLGALLDASMALVPMGTRIRTDSLGVTVDLAVALVSIRGGRVVWRHTVEGGPAGSTDAGIAAAAAALARTLIREEG